MSNRRVPAGGASFVVLIAATALIVGGANAAGAVASCVGDCDGDGSVAVAEVVSGVSVALARRPLRACAAMDANTDGSVSVAELTSAVGFALQGCPPVPTPIPTGCGDPATVARFRDCVRSETERQCLDAGGEWGRYPYSGREGCFCPTGQGGCECDSRDDCLSFCIGWPGGGGVDSCAQVTAGTCNDVSPRAGCFCTPFGGGFTALCVDP